MRRLTCRRNRRTLEEPLRHVPLRPVRCLLLARRLVESGVRFVTINAFLTVFDEVTWDIHGSKPFTSIEGMRDIVCSMYDRAYTALVEDLCARLRECSIRRSSRL